MNSRVKLFGLLALAVVGLFFIIVFIYLLNTPKEHSYEMPKNKGADSGAGAPSSTSEEELNRRSFVVSSLIDKLPYSGTDFALDYTFSGARFILYVNPDKQNEANAEFENYLKENGVEDRSWIENLFVSYVFPPPANEQANPAP